MNDVDAKKLEGLSTEVLQEMEFSITLAVQAGMRRELGLEILACVGDILQIRGVGSLITKEGTFKGGG